MSQERASEVGFCVVDSNADLIAETMIRRLRETAIAMERDVNRLHRGRRSFALSELAQVDLERTIRRLSYMVDTLRGVQDAKKQAAYLEAAE
jgi:ribosomal protein L13E